VTKSKLIAIIGQTATGKTALAIKLAKKINGEIISADSRQVYKGLALLSGQPTKKEMAGTPHYFIGTENPKKVFSVALYQKKAYKTITDILARGKVPILVGGTGLYLDAIIKGVALPEVSPNYALRKQLYLKSPIALLDQLKKLDSERARNIDQKNPARLVRAIEIAIALGKVPKQKLDPQYTVLTVGISVLEKKLKANIKKRILERLKKGMLKEAARLHTKGLSYKRLEALGLECRLGSYYLQKKISKNEFINQLETATWQYAKRQKTWFKKEAVVWVSNENKKVAERKVYSLAGNFIKKNHSIS
jgi:tRNA dimethylallyltransferase